MTARARHPKPGGPARSGRGRPLAGAVCAVLALCPAPTRALGPDLGQVAARLPHRVEFVAALDNGAELRRALGDSPLMLTLAAQGQSAAVVDAWSLLAADLGMTDAEAFDLLLGRRVIFAASGLEAGAAGSEWAILSELDPETDRRLRSDLGAVPRRIVNGQPVLEMEHGSFLLATSAGRLRCGDDGPFENDPASTIMLLAPAEDRELFEAMLPLLRCRTPERALAATPAGAAAAAMTTRDALLLWRLPDPAAAPDRFVAATFGLSEDVWEIEAVAAPSGGWLPDTDLAGIEPWSPGMLEKLPDGPSLAVIGLRSMVTDAQQWLVPLLSPGLPQSDLDRLDHLLGDRSLLALWLSEDRAGDHQSAAEVLIATETRDLSALAERSDAILAGSAASDRKQEPAPQRDPAEVRSLRLQGPERAPADAPPPTLQWAYVKDSGSRSAREGWLVVHFDPTGEWRNADPARAQPGQPASLPVRRYLHVGRAKPEALAGRTGPLPGKGAGMSFVSVLLSRVHSLEWAVWVDEPGHALEAELTLRTAEPTSAEQ